MIFNEQVGTGEFFLFILVQFVFCTASFSQVDSGNINLAETIRK